MKQMSQHTEWLSMVEVSGPFLAIPVLEKIFPQGLDSLETYRKNRIRSAYDEWRDAAENNDPQFAELHLAWVNLVLKELLEFDDNLLSLPTDDVIFKSLDGNGNFRPNYVIKADANSSPLMFVSILPEGTDLEKVKTGDGWPVPIYERMSLLCRHMGVRLGLITNGERWMLVNAPVGNTSSHTSWYARLWFQEPITLKAFQSLLGVRRWFGPEEETLPSMLEESLQHHEEVTDTLGEQVKRAVEVLVQCLDKADQDRNRELLHDVPPAELYEAGLTVMMRLVFVLCAEERELLLQGEPIYDQYYSISTLRGQLTEEADQHGHEVLERRHDAWARLLAVFRAVYAGIEHETMRLPALGGSLFDPDRFPFLEGRAKGTRWQDTSARPLPIDNRTVLLLLEALQVLEQRGGALMLSYKALDVEQIGHVYEGLLEHTVQRLPKDTLGLAGSQKAKNPNIPLAELESARLDGDEAVIALVQEVTQRSASAITKALSKDVDDGTFGKVITVCGGDLELANRIKPFAHLLRMDAWGDLIVYRKNSFAVTLGADRRETGTHYTPKSLTESIVNTTLEPVAYIGPADGKPREEWQIKSPAELLELKICDPAMGSGAFLVQVCRWLSERLVESCGKEEVKGKFVTVDGVVLSNAGGAEPMPNSLDERLLISRRLVAERCLYGVDMNPLAVELAKLSIWLITLAKGRPFGFLDHNLRSGDSLLGIHDLKQLYCFDLHANDKTSKKLFAQKMDEHVNEALALRKKLRDVPIRDIQDVQYMERLDRQARQKLERIEHIADAIIGEALASGDNEKAMETSMQALSVWASAYIDGNDEIGQKIISSARKALSTDLPAGKLPRKPFHWALVFPEVFERGGFDGIVGNPPWGAKLTTSVKKYIDFCYKLVGDYETAIAFIERASGLAKSIGSVSLVLPNTFFLNDSSLKCRDYIANNFTTLSVLDLSNSDVFKGRNVRCCVITIVCSILENISSFKYSKNLSVREDQVLHVSTTELKQRKHWGALSDKGVSYSNVTSTIDDWFDVKQGYIPYRKSTLIKRFGKQEGENILNNRLWHSLSQETEDHIRELKGKDVSRWNVEWSGLWVKYGDWVSTYLDKTWFNGSRVLVREIVGSLPRLIIAAQSNEQFVHNPSIILVKPKFEMSGLLCFLELYLNSSVATNYILLNSSKVSKGMFPKVLVKDIRELPFPPIYTLDEKIINKAIQFRSDLIKDESLWEEADAFIEEIIDTQALNKPIDLSKVTTCATLSAQAGDFPKSKAMQLEANLFDFMNDEKENLS